MLWVVVSSIVLAACARVPAPSPPSSPTVMPLLAGGDPLGTGWHSGMVERAAARVPDPTRGGAGDSRAGLAVASVHGGVAGDRPLRGGRRLRGVSSHGCRRARGHAARACPRDAARGPRGRQPVLFYLPRDGLRTSGRVGSAPRERRRGVRPSVIREPSGGGVTEGGGPPSVPNRKCPRRARSGTRRLRSLPRARLGPRRGAAPPGRSPGRPAPPLRRPARRRERLRRLPHPRHQPRLPLGAPLARHRPRTRAALSLAREPAPATSAPQPARLGG
jgi:hypothetical protein